MRTKIMIIRNLRGSLQKKLEEMNPVLVIQAKNIKIVVDQFSKIINVKITPKIVTTDK